ncbi:MAG: ribosomal protein S18-alanine N-acetyltransferase [bacterium]|nr:ribosomal protein S18-alanine N-acetyltransferase [bacterium]
MDNIQSETVTLPEFALAPMATEHLDAVLAIEQVGFSNPWQEQDFRYALAREGSFCLVAQKDTRVIGYAVGFLVSREYHLADFAVHPEIQRRGVGREFLGQLLGRLEEASVAAVTLEVRVSNSRAMDLYSKFGFQTVAIRRGYYSNPREDALVMLKPLVGDLSEWVRSSTFSGPAGGGGCSIKRS